MGSMETSSYGGMTPGSNYNQPMGGPPGGFGGQSFGPPSTYALPSGIGAPSPYMPGGYAQMASNGQTQGGFDSRAEQAFNQGNASATGGAPGYSNGANYGGSSNAQYGNNDNSDVSLAFLNAGMGNLGFGERDDRRNGQGGAKSPQ